MAPLWMLAILAGLAALRLFELAQAARARRHLEARGATWVPADGYGLLVAVHVLVLAGAAAEAWAPWAREGWYSVPAGFLFAVGMALRYWSKATLGWRWSTRVYRMPSEPLVAAGPYRWMRHPIYVGVFLELVAIPLLAGLWLTLGVTAILHLVALRRRIAIEEQALAERA